MILSIWQGVVCFEFLLEQDCSLADIVWHSSPMPAFRRVTLRSDREDMDWSAPV